MRTHRVLAPPVTGVLLFCAACGDGLPVSPENEPPVVRITAPPDRSLHHEGETVAFRGVANDPEGGALSGSLLRWESDEAGPIGTGMEFSRDDLSPGQHTISLTATDDQGAVGITQITIKVNSLPEVTINSPPDGDAFEAGVELGFRGFAMDREDGSLSGAALVWESDRDGQLGIGREFSRDDLSPGRHIITLTGTDSDGGMDTAAATITINTAPDVEIEAPEDGVVVEVGSVVGFRGSAADEEDGPLRGDALVWESSRDGQIGIGREFETADLSTGRHLVTLSATDAHGVAGADTVAITVNSVPDALIRTPASRSLFHVGMSVRFEGIATDAEDGALDGAALIWESNQDGQIGLGREFSRDDLTSGVHLITLIALDDNGTTGRDTATITINARPQATIAAPTSGAVFDAGTDVTFRGSATDEEDGALRGSALVWESDRDGEIGTGEGFSRDDLSIGVHQITLTAQDSDQAVGTDAVTVVIEQGPGPINMNDTIAGRLGPGDIDEYTFQSVAGQEVAVFLQGLTGDDSDRFRLRLLDRAGTLDEAVLGGVVESRGDDPSLTVTECRFSGCESTGRVVLPRTGTYTVRVQGRDDRTTRGAYRLLVHPVDREPEGHASAITPGDTISGVRIDPPGDVDEYTFQGAAGQNVTVFLQALSGDRSDRLVMRVLTRAGTVLGAIVDSRGTDSSLEDQNTGRITLPATDTYVIQVFGWTSRTDSGPYRLHVR